MDSDLVVQCNVNCNPINVIMMKSFKKIQNLTLKRIFQHLRV